MRRGLEVEYHCTGVNQEPLPSLKREPLPSLKRERRPVSEISLEIRQNLRILRLAFPGL